MKLSLLILILAFLTFSQVFSMRIWEKNLKDHIKTLKIKTKLGVKHRGKPKKLINVNVKFSALPHNQQQAQKATQTRSKISKVKRQRMMKPYFGTNFGKTSVFGNFS
jgi:hypothetical protein